MANQTILTAALMTYTTLERLARLKDLTERVEKPAQTAEVEIWRELAEGQKNRDTRSRED